MQGVPASDAYGTYLLTGAFKLYLLPLALSFFLLFFPRLVVLLFFFFFFFSFFICAPTPLPPPEAIYAWKKNVLKDLVVTKSLREQNRNTPAHSKLQTETY